ncbi:MAG: ArsI/CadI family heavy metal resistance metalloenzyme [Actinomycetota bacterium]
MLRVQLALNVESIETAVDFYRRLFSAEPAKIRPGYANFALDEPPLKLVLIEKKGAGTRLNHLGVEVGSEADVRAAEGRLAREGLATASEKGTCCYAVQDKVWVNDPDGAPWEVYTVVADASTPETMAQGVHDAACC